MAGVMRFSSVLRTVCAQPCVSQGGAWAVVHVNHHIISVTSFTIALA